MRTPPKTIFYSDELNEEFSKMSIKPKYIGTDYTYIHNGLWKKITHIFWYRIIAKPIAWIYLKLRYKHKIIGKNKLKGFKGYFLYGNHTNAIADALIPTFISRKDTYVIVHPNNVSIPILGKITPSLGAIPLPDDRRAIKSFNDAISIRIANKNTVCIYPEAHIWPYYTKIRPFTNASFRYPVKEKVPVFCFTNTYQKAWPIGTKIVTYIDGPFEYDENQSLDMAKESLRGQVFDAMIERAKCNNVEKINYVRKS